MKLYLTSLNLDSFPKFVGSEIRNKTVLFIPTAANVYTDKWFVEADREKLTELGFILDEFDLENKTKDDVREALSNVDIVYLSGGNSFFLLDMIYKSGFDKEVRTFLDNGGIYVGASAGAVVAGIDIEPLSIFDDPSEAPDLTTTKGLGLVPFVILPHFGKEKYKAKYESIFSKYNDEELQITTLTDAQYITADNNGVTIKTI